MTEKRHAGKRKAVIAVLRKANESLRRKKVLSKESASTEEEDPSRRVLYQAEMLTLNNSSSFLSDDTEINAKLKDFVKDVR